jgi:GTP-binding protein Era
VLVIDAAAKLGGKVEQMIRASKGASNPRILVLNKVDIAKKANLLVLAANLSERLKPEAVFMIALRPETASRSSSAHLATANAGQPWHFPEDQLTDVTDRMVAAELTREQLYLQLHAELPYASAVTTEKMGGSQGWLDRHPPADPDRARQPEGDRRRQGRIAPEANRRRRPRAIGEHLGRKVHLFLHVKVSPKWGEDRGLYEDIGLGLGRLTLALLSHPCGR